MLKRLIHKFKADRFSHAPEFFVERNNWFTMRLPVNWLFSESYTGYYFFANNDLKGGIDFTINTKKDLVFADTLAYARYVLKSDYSTERFSSQLISNCDFLKIDYRAESSNMNFTSCFLKHEKALIHIRLMLFEDESEEEQAFWRDEFYTILASLKFNFEEIN